MIEKHKTFFDSFDKIIVYYDNGQIELGAILNTVFSIHLSNVEQKTFFKAIGKKRLGK